MPPPGLESWGGLGQTPEAAAAMAGDYVWDAGAGNPLGRDQDEVLPRYKRLQSTRRAPKNLEDNRIQSMGRTLGDLRGIVLWMSSSAVVGSFWGI